VERTDARIDRVARDEAIGDAAAGVPMGDQEALGLGHAGKMRLLEHVVATPVVIRQESPIARVDSPIKSPGSILLTLVAGSFHSVGGTTGNHFG
jgi:hypothetical protein